MALAQVVRTWKEEEEEEEEEQEEETDDDDDEAAVAVEEMGLRNGTGFKSP